MGSGKKYFKHFDNQKKKESIPQIGNTDSWGNPTEEQMQTVGSQQHDQMQSVLREEQKQEEQEDTPNEKRLMVIDGAKLKCPYAQAEGVLKVTSNELKLQDQIWATEGDCSNMVNLQFQGLCNHPKWGDKKPPCMSVINLSPWQNLGDTYTQEQLVLIKSSTIECNPAPNTAVAKPIPVVESIADKESSDVYCSCNRGLTVQEVKNIIIQLRQKEVYIKSGRLIKDDKGKPILVNGKKQYRDITQYDQLGEKLFHLDYAEKINTSEANFESFTKALNNAFTKYNINTCIRRIHFLAQCYHETGRFTLTYEKLANPDNCSYKGGATFRGRGLIQVTHNYDYANYYNHINKSSHKLDNKDFYQKLLIPFTKKLSTELAYACDSAGWEWAIQKTASYSKAENKEKYKEILNKSLNEIADYGDAYRLTISRLINGGNNGKSERKMYYDFLKEIMKYNQCKNKNNEIKTSFKEE